jgi:hypothetical protein
MTTCLIMFFAGLIWTVVVRVAQGRCPRCQYWHSRSEPCPVNLRLSARRHPLRQLQSFVFFVKYRHWEPSQARNTVNAGKQRCSGRRKVLGRATVPPACRAPVAGGIGVPLRVHPPARKCSSSALPWLLGGVWPAVRSTTRTRAHRGDFGRWQR